MVVQYSPLILCYYILALIVTVLLATLQLLTCLVGEFHTMYMFNYKLMRNRKKQKQYKAPKKKTQFLTQLAKSVESVASDNSSASSSLSLSQIL
uniref:Uncharacterized protein n=1 Tax=Eutreptiella gymnastica TaxID=73025 RepID=A0A7S4CLB5_9EUGL